MREVVEKLLNSDESSYSIGKGSGVDVSLVHRVRSGENSLDRMQFKNVEKLYQYAIKKQKEES